MIVQVTSGSKSHVVRLTSKRLLLMLMEYCSDANIANLWASTFKDLLTSPGPKAHRQLDYTLKITTGELEAPNVTPDTIQRAIKKLKRKNPMVRF